MIITESGKVKNINKKTRIGKRKLYPTNIHVHTALCGTEYQVSRNYTTSIVAKVRLGAYGHESKTFC